MKHSALLPIFLMLALSACNKDKPAEAPAAPASFPSLSAMNIPDTAPASALPPGHPSTVSGVPAMTAPSMAPPSLSSQSYALTQTGTVVSFIDVPQFTYIEVKQNGSTRWLAAKTIAVKKGDTVKFDNGATMENFNSKSLNRTFASLTFVNKVTVGK